MKLTQRTFLILISILSFIFLFNVIKTNNSKRTPKSISEKSFNIQKQSSEIQMYYYIKLYSKEFNIPEEYAFGVAYYETTYMGPHHKGYNHIQTSYAGALGPMQIMPSTAAAVLNRPVGKIALNTSVKLNVYISMKLLRMLHDKYNNWEIVFGAYNTGKPISNHYAKKIIKCNYKWY